MGIISNVIDFVFPLQRPQKLYRPQRRFIQPASAFRSPRLERRFSQRRLWPNGVYSQRTYSSNISVPVPNQFRRPLARPVSPSQNPLPAPVKKNTFLSEMFSSDMHLPTQRPMQKRNGFGGKVLNAMRWNNILFK